MRFARALHCLPLMAVFGFASCGNDPNPKPLASAHADGSPWTVYYGSLSAEARSLDPQYAYDQISHHILEPIYDTLLQYAVMKTDPYEVEPCLLESMPEKVQEADGSVSYACRLKSGIFFHDDPCFPGGKGREVVARDVQYAFQRLSDPAEESPVFSDLAEYVRGMDEIFKEARQTGRFDYDHQTVSGVELIDAYSFKLHLLKPYPQILYWLAQQFTAPVAREAVTYYDGKAGRPLFKFHPVGDGPFKLDSWIPNQSFRFVRNPTYHTTVFPTGGWKPEYEAADRPLAGRTLPLVDEVDLTVFREILPIWLLTRQGYIDRYGVMKDAANSALTSTNELAPKYAARGMKLNKELEVSTFFMVFNMQDPLVGSNRKLRQALSCSYNPQGFIDLLYGGAAPIAQQMLPPGIFGYDKDFKNPYGFNLEKARRLIAEAGYPDGIDPKTNAPLELALDVVAAGGEERQLAEYDQRQLEQIGVKVRLIEDTFARQQEKEDQGNFQIIAGSGWGADYPDPENFFFLLYSKNFPPAGKNAARYANPEFDKTFEQMACIENSPERLELIRKLNDIEIEDCPILLNFNKGYYLISQPWAPLTHSNMLLEGGLKYASVDPVLRKQKQREWNPIAKWPAPAALLVVAGVVGCAIQLNRKRNA